MSSIANRIFRQPSSPLSCNMSTKLKSSTVEVADMDVRNRSADSSWLMTVGMPSVRHEGNIQDLAVLVCSSTRSDGSTRSRSSSSRNMSHSCRASVSVQSEFPTLSPNPDQTSRYPTSLPHINLERRAQCASRETYTIHFRTEDQTSSSTNGRPIWNT